MQEATLMLSSNHGRYGLRIGGEEWSDLTSGAAIEISLGGHWIAGRIEYDHDQIYALPGPQRLEEVTLMAARPKGIAGYYFEADEGGESCGLCVGMKVRVL